MRTAEMEREATINRVMYERPEATRHEAEVEADTRIRIDEAMAGLYVYVIERMAAA